MNYVVSQWGSGVSVGLAGKPEEVKEDFNLAHNLFNTRSYEDLFNGRMNFPSLRQFYKFLVYKHCLADMADNQISLRESIKKNKKSTRAHFIMKKNFMQELNKLPVSYKFGAYNDGDFGYYYED